MKEPELGIATATCKAAGTNRCSYQKSKQKFIHFENMNTFVHPFPRR